MNRLIKNIRLSFYNYLFKSLFQLSKRSTLFKLVPYTICAKLNKSLTTLGFSLLTHLNETKQYAHLLSLKILLFVIFFYFSDILKF